MARMIDWKKLWCLCPECKITYYDYTAPNARLSPDGFYRLVRCSACNRKRVRRVDHPDQGTFNFKEANG